MPWQYVRIEVARDEIRGDSTILSVETEDNRIRNLIQSNGQTYSLKLLNMLGKEDWELVTETPMAMDKQSSQSYDFPARIVCTFKKEIR